MRSLGYAVLFVALVGGGIFMCNMLSDLARDKCNRNCPGDPSKLVTKFNVGPLHYVECTCD